MAFGILIIALIVVLILLLAGAGLTPEQREARLMESGRFIQGVSVEGVDISGQTIEEAAVNETLLSIAQQMEAGFTYTFTAGGHEKTLSANELGITSSLNKTLGDAMKFGQLGDGAAVREQKAQAQESGYDFKLGMYADEAVVLEKLTALKPTIDTLPQDATLEILDDMQGEERFKYIAEVTGVDIDVSAFAKVISENINSGNYSVVEAPAIITNPSVDVATLKANTKLIGTFTSSFDGNGLDNADRVTNIRLMSGIVNGTIIQPGETWSINDAAGPRDDDTAKTVGWAYAPGIADGKYRMEVGGGVCQVSSTLYNACIRAELTIVERRQHSWPSSYIPKGMDATISTGGPDLKMSNPYDMPVYIETVLDEEEKELTVNVYGPPLTHGYKVEFTNTLVATDKAPDTEYHYNAATDPEGGAIGAGKSVEWVKSRDGQTWEVYKQYVNDAGDVVKSEFFSKDTYKAFQGVTYVNGADPDAAPSTPAE
jgi:vancomycin resistance protein YoaR